MIERLPAQILAERLREKLIEQGVEEDLDEISLALAKHVLERSSAEFTWNKGGSKSQKSVVLDFNEADAAEVDEDIKVVTRKLPRIVSKAVLSTAKAQARDLRKEWPSRRAAERADTQHFRDNLEIHWGKGLRELRMLLLGAREIGNDRLAALKRSKAKRNLIKREVLILLHLNACRIMDEIILLLESGYSDGALARWRTLYELAVVGELIAEGNDDLADRYLMHRTVTAKKELELDQRLGFTRDPEEANQIENNYRAMLAQFGDNFRYDYGWASQHLRKKNPRLRDLEEAAKMTELPPEYKSASYTVHAGVTGVRWNVGQVYNEGLPVSGATNAGLEFPAKHAAFTFTRITALLIVKSRRLENLVTLNMLLAIRDRAEREFDKAARKLIIYDDAWSVDGFDGN